MRAVKAMAEGLERIPAGHQQSRAVAVLDDVLHHMSDPRMRSCNKFQHLVAACRQNRGISIVQEYLQDAPRFYACAQDMCMC